MKRVRIIFLFFTLCFYSSLFAQIEILFNSNNYDEFCGRAVSSSTGNTFFILWKGEIQPNFYHESFLYKISSTGDTLRSQFSKVDTVLQFAEILLDQDENILITGDAWRLNATGSLVDKFQWFGKFDQDLNLIWEKAYSIQNVDVSTKFTGLFELIGDRYIYLSSSKVDTSLNQYMYLFELDYNGDSLFYKLYENDLSAKYNLCITYNYDSTDLLFHTFRADNYTKSPIKTLNVNQSYDTLSTWYYPYLLFTYPFTTKLNDNKHTYSSGKFRILNSNYEFEYYTRVIKFDTIFNPIGTIDLTYTEPEVEVIPAWFCSLDFYYQNHLFVGCMYNNNGAPFSTDPSFIYIACLDEELNVKHEEYIGGDAYYHLFAVCATSDGGVVLTGTKYDYMMQDNEQDGIVWKFDSTFFVKQEEFQLPDFEADISINPNPCNDYTIFSSKSNGILQVYNLSGKRIVEFRVSKGTTRLNMSYLKEGTYIWTFRSYSSISKFQSGKLIIVNS